MKNLLGIGIYSAKEAEQLINVKHADIVRWMFGSDNARPLWDNQLNSLDVKYIGFHDLLELRVVNHLREKGISLQAIREAITFAKATYNDEHPLISRRFMTDGKSIFSETAKKTNDSELLDLLKRQYVIKPVVEKGLFAGIEYDTFGKKALRWRPNVKKFKSVVLDPELSFGKPIIDGTGITTSTLYDAYCVEDKNIKFVASLFEVQESAVKTAVAYEKSIGIQVAA